MIHQRVLPAINSIQFFSFAASSSYEPTVNEVNVPVLNRDQCNEWLVHLNVTDGMICAGYKEGGKDACQGEKLLLDETFLFFNESKLTLFLLVLQVILVARCCAVILLTVIDIMLPELSPGELNVQGKFRLDPN